MQKVKRLKKTIFGLILLFAVMYTYSCNSLGNSMTLKGIVTQINTEQNNYSAHKFNFEEIALLVAFVIVISYFSITIFSFLEFIIINTINAIYYAITGQPLFVHFEFRRRRLTKEQESLLFENFKYYRDLPENKKPIFASRVAKFIKKKHFLGRQGLEITDEMKVLIAGSAIKLTFGFHYYLLDTFHTIIIYPEEYYSQSSQSYNKGETNVAGVIVFSWKDLVLGNNTKSDYLNLGFHEFAHALLCHERETMANISFRKYIHKWTDLLNDGVTLRLIKEHHVFRDYALINENEFFAVAVENFFEGPEHLNSELPELYAILRGMLNQDPLTQTTYLQ